MARRVVLSAGLGLLVAGGLLLRRQDRRTTVAGVTLAGPTTVGPTVPAPVPGREFAGPSVPGRPRFYLQAGDGSGAVAHGSAAAVGEDGAKVLGAGRFVLGRSPAADLRLTDGTVALEHAEVQVSGDGRVFVRDLGGGDGVLVDGVVRSVAELFDGSRVELGEVTLLFHRDDGEGSQGRDGFDRVDGA